MTFFLSCAHLSDQMVGRIAETQASHLRLRAIGRKNERDERRGKIEGDMIGKKKKERERGREEEGDRRGKKIATHL